MHSPSGYWVHTLSPYLVEFGNGIGIRYYGLSYALAFLLSVWLMGRYARRGKLALSRDEVGDLLLYLMAGVVVGGRVGHYLLYEGWRSFTEDPLQLLRVWEGGMAFHGGLTGVMLAIFLFSLGKGRPSFLRLADPLATVAPLGLFLVRMANFINGELWGKASEQPWAIIFPLAEAPGLPVALMTPRHPSQLYEAALEGLLLFSYLQWRLWRGRDLRPGRLTGEFFLGYALARTLCELFREPDRGMDLILGLSRGTFYSLFMVAAGLVFVFLARRTQATPASVK